MRKARLVVMLGVLAVLVMGQGKTVLDGVYTAEQAKKGETSYLDSCSACHLGNLEGADDAPALIGDEFLDQWNNRPLADLYRVIQQTMPQDAPGSLTVPQYRDILTYILKANKMPAGNAELPVEMDRLREIRIQARK